MGAVCSRAGEDAFEAQLHISMLRDIIDVQATGEEKSSKRASRKLKPETVYLGMYRFSSANEDHRKQALQQSVRAIFRAALKLIETKGVDPSTCMDKLKALV